MDNMNVNYMNILLYLYDIQTGCINAIEHNGIYCETILLIFMHIKHMDQLIKYISRHLYIQPLIAVLVIFNFLLNISGKLLSWPKNVNHYVSNQYGLA